MPNKKRPIATTSRKSTSSARGKPPLVRASYEELLSFLRYFRHFGTPVIIGGWAVYFYNPYYGSVDVDVVGPSLRGTFYETVERYERSHEYVITQNDPLGIEVTASKPIYNKRNKKKKIGDMEIDACSYEQTGASAFHEDGSKLLPYSLCDQEANRRLVNLARNCVCYAPSRALLTLFKIKARRDRTFDVRTRGATMGPSRLEWLRSKIVKDGSDIIALLDDKSKTTKAILNEPLDTNQMRRMGSEHGISDLARETLREVLNDRRALELYGRSVDTASIWRSIEKAL